MALSAAGEDTLAICPNCGYAANLEVAVSSRTMAEEDSAAQATPVAGPAEEVFTPNCKTIAELADFLAIPVSATAKAVFFAAPERGLLFVVVRGDREVNESKLRKAADVSALVPASAEQIAATGAVAGYASPVGLHDVTVIADHSVVSVGPLVAGANREGHHLHNVVYGRDWQADLVADITTVDAGDPCVRCGTALKLERGIEIGHIFKLGTRYTAAIGAVYLDLNGVAQPIVMGSYGIGVERLLQVIVEQHHDKAGIVWPDSVAPFDVHLVRIGKQDEVCAAGDALYAELEDAGLRTLYDDRGETAGVKFNDADLIGVPIRLVISERLLQAGEVEVKPRSGTALKVARADLLEAIQSLRPA
jgi:prolyl-tRNA synthetase